MQRKSYLHARRAELLNDMKATLVGAENEHRDLDDDERTLYDSWKQEHAKCGAELARIEELEALEAESATVVPAAARNHPVGSVDRLPPGPEPAREFESLGEFMHAVRFRPSDQRLEWRDSTHAEQRMDSGAAGGFAIPKQFIGQLREVTPADAVIRPRAQVLPAGTPPDAEISMPALDQTGDNPANSYGGISVAWIGEGAAKPETSLSLREITWKPHEAAAHTVLTDKLLRNWQAASSLIERQLRAAMIAAEDYAFLRGDGQSKPKGIIGHPAAKTVNRAEANEIHYADVIKMYADAMQGTSKVWIASQQILPQLMNMKDDSGGSGDNGGGAYIWQPNGREGVPSTLLGLPIIWNPRSPALGSQGDLVLADLSYYIIKDGSGPFVQASEHVHFINNKTVIKITWNVDGAPWLTEPFKQENGNTVSPFVVLDVPNG